MEKEKCLCEKEYITLDSGLSLEIRNGNLEFDYRNCACGAFEDKIKIKYCPLCGNKIDLRKEVPQHLEMFKELYKSFKGNCEKMSGLKAGEKGIDCKECIFGGKDGNKYYCNRIIDMLADMNKKYKLDK